jgi:hypothetical protein
MKPGEVRWSWFKAQDSDTCDHSGCAGSPTPYAARLELVSVTRHHDDLPDGMHVTAWPFLGVRQGTRWAALPGDRVKQINSVKLAGDKVTIDLVVTRFPENDPRREQIVVATDELRARLEEVGGIDAMKRKKWKAAKAAFDRAIALDTPYLHLASCGRTARVARGSERDRSRCDAQPGRRLLACDVGRRVRQAALAPRDPRPGGRLAGIVRSGAAVSLPRELPRDRGRPEQAFRCRVCGHGPLGRTWPVVWRVEDPRSAERRFGRDDPLDDGRGDTDGDGSPRCARCKRLLAAQKMLRDLGFSPPPHAPVTIDYFDPQYRWPYRPHVVFTDARLVLALAADRPKTSNQFIAIAPPVDTTVTDAYLLGDLVIYRWARHQVTDVIAFRRP